MSNSVPPGGERLFAVLSHDATKKGGRGGRPLGRCCKRTRWRGDRPLRRHLGRGDSVRDDFETNLRYS